MIKSTDDGCLTTHLRWMALLMLWAQKGLIGETEAMWPKYLGWVTSSGFSVQCCTCGRGAFGSSSYAIAAWCTKRPNCSTSAWPIWGCLSVADSYRTGRSCLVPVTPTLLLPPRSVCAEVCQMSWRQETFKTLSTPKLTHDQTLLIGFHPLHVICADK